MSRIRSVLALCVSAALLSAAPLSSQTACGWSSRAGETGLPVNVEQIVAQLPASWSNPDEVIAQLKQWYQACDGTAARKAIFELRRALERNRGNQAISALYGTALMHGPEVQVEGATGVTNRATFHLSNSERDGARLLARAARQPGLEVAALELAEVALATRHEPTVELAIETLQHTTAAGRTPAHWRLLAELSFVSADYAAARASAERAVELGDSAAFRALGLARVMIDGDTAAAAAAYLAGVATPAALDMYYDDISYLLDATDTLAWHALPAAERPEWIRQQWAWRAATASQSIAERLKLHFTRLAHAMEAFPRTAFSTPPGLSSVVQDARIRRMTLDDRGLIYVRHGEPDEVIRVRNGSVDPYRLAWGYTGLGTGSALFEFTKNDCFTSPGRGGAPEVSCLPTGDYFLSAPVPCGEVGRRTAEITYLDYGSEISRYDRALSASMTNCFSANATGNSDAIRTQQLRDIEHRRRSIQEGMVAMRTESASRELAIPIGVLVKTYALRDVDGTSMFAFAALDGGVIEPRPGTSEYALRLLLSVENHAARTATQVDTTLAFRTAAPMTAGQLARTSIVAFAAPATDATIRFAVRNANNSEQGQIVTTAREIPDYSGDRFMLSDLVLAEPRDGTWTRGGIRLAPLPAHQVAAGATFRLFHELYNVRDGDPLEVEITIAPGAPESLVAELKDLVTSRGAQQIAFDDIARADARGTATLMREVGANLEPGRYLVTVTVHNTRLQQTARAATDLIILP